AKAGKGAAADTAPAPAPGAGPEPEQHLAGDGTDTVALRTVRSGRR
ncbi:hypothetical protein GPJ59_11540, partial [Streptomyces bambusae]|nr:hypothetical protein [Streptomyces bambusae]